jgi:hypothetical protein
MKEKSKNPKEEEKREKIADIVTYLALSDPKTLNDFIEDLHKKCNGTSIEKLEPSLENYKKLKESKNALENLKKQKPEYDAVSEEIKETFKEIVRGIISLNKEEINIMHLEIARIAKIEEFKKKMREIEKRKKKEEKKFKEKKENKRKNKRNDDVPLELFA